MPDAGNRRGCLKIRGLSGFYRTNCLASYRHLISAASKIAPKTTLPASGAIKGNPAFLVFISSVATMLEHMRMHDEIEQWQEEQDIEDIRRAAEFANSEISYIRRDGSAQPTMKEVKIDKDRDIIVNRLGGNHPDNFIPKPGEETTGNAKKGIPPGISVLLIVPPQVAAEQMRLAFAGERFTKIREMANVTAWSTVKQIYAAGFFVVPTRSDKLPNHGTLGHPLGAVGFTEENRLKLSLIFRNVPTPPLIPFTK